jgi:hypothetical protein
MTSRVRSITFDCADPGALARFWVGVTGYTLSAEDGEGALVVHPEGAFPRLLFLKVPEGKSAKNRVHLDLQPDDTMDREVDRVVGLGARKLRLVEEHGSRFTVMQDPEDNEFSIEQGPGDLRG